MVQSRRNIILTGFMGTGKSTVGRRLAARLGRRFFDTDTLIEKQAKTTISNIFSQKGEAYFRGLEKETIKRMCQKKAIVLATGGGAIVSEENAQRLKESGTVVCLTATPETIFERIRNNADRPLLQGQEPLEKIRALLATRAEAYTRADLTIDTSTLDIERVVETIISLVEKSQ